MNEKSSISDLNSGLNVFDLTQGKKSTISGNYFPDIVLPILLKNRHKESEALIILSCFAFSQVTKKE